MNYNKETENNFLQMQSNYFDGKSDSMRDALLYIMPWIKNRSIKTCNQFYIPLDHADDIANETYCILLTRYNKKQKQYNNIGALIKFATMQAALKILKYLKNETEFTDYYDNSEPEINQDSMQDIIREWERQTHRKLNFFDLQKLNANLYIRRKKQ